MGAGVTGRAGGGAKASSPSAALEHSRLPWGGATPHTLSGREGPAPPPHPQRPAHLQPQALPCPGPAASDIPQPAAPRCNHFPLGSRGETGPAHPCRLLRRPHPGSSGSKRHPGSPATPPPGQTPSFSALPFKYFKNAEQRRKCRPCRPQSPGSRAERKQDSGLPVPTETREWSSCWEELSSQIAVLGSSFCGPGLLL